MIYSFESRIRYSELDCKGRLTLSAIVNYFQDTSTFHSEKLQLGLDFLDHSNKAWILTNWRILLYDQAKLGDQIRVSTWAYDMKGFYGLRNFVLETEDGRRIAAADTTWVYMDMEKGKPVRIPQDLTAAYEPEEGIPMEKCPRKIAVPENYSSREPFAVPSYFIDTNQHMNNGRYVQLAESFLPEDFVVREMRVEYRSSAVMGDVIYPRITVEEKQCTINLADENGKTYAVLVFLGEVSSKPESTE